MTSTLGSFDQSPLGAFVASPLGARGQLSTTKQQGDLYVSGTFTAFNGSGTLNRLIAYDQFLTDTWISFKSGLTDTEAQLITGHCIFNNTLYICSNQSGAACVFYWDNELEKFLDLGALFERLRGNAKWIGVYGGQLVVVGHALTNKTVKESITSTGTGVTVDLGGNEPNFEGFVDAGFGGQTVEYQIDDGAAFETGIGTITDDSPDTLSRDTVTDSSDSGNRINLSGSATVLETQTHAGAWAWDPEIGEWSELGNFVTDDADINGALVAKSNLYVYGENNTTITESALIEVWDGSAWSRPAGRPYGANRPVTGGAKTGKWEVLAMAAHKGKIYIAGVWNSPSPGQYDQYVNGTDANDGELAGTLLQWDGLTDNAFIVIGDTSRHGDPDSDPGTSFEVGPLPAEDISQLFSHKSTLYCLGVNYADTDSAPANADQFGGICTIDSTADPGSQFSDLNGGLRKDTDTPGRAIWCDSYGDLLAVVSHDSDRAGYPSTDATANSIHGWNPGSGAWEQLESASGTTAAAQSVTRIFNSGVDLAVQEPSISISSPADQSSHTEGASVSFAGTASDKQDGTISSNIIWTSSQDGQIGTGASFSVSTLSLGAHTITASITDSDGNTSTDQILISIVVSNDPPVVTIDSPNDMDTFGSGETIDFEGTATDTEDGDISSDIEWSSRQDGPLGTGASISVVLSDNTHQITATVEDSDGNTDSDTIEITVG